MLNDADDEGKTCLRMCILGGGGYLGQCLAKTLQKCGHYVIILDLQFQNFPHIVLNPAALHFIQASILDIDKLHEALNGVDSCFHLAGYGMTGGASLNRRMTMLVNYDGTRTVLNACRQLFVRHVVFASSISVVYRGDELHNSDENEPYATIFPNPYAESKCLAEKEVIAANHKAGIELLTCALRFRGIYGPGELRTTQRTINLGLSGFIVAKFRKSANPLTQYSSAENCINALVLAEKSLRLGGRQSPARAQIFNIVDGGPPVDPFGFWDPLIAAVSGRVPNLYVPYSIVKAAAWIFEILYHTLGVEPLFTRFEVNLLATTNTFSIEKARRDLGYCPVHNHDLTATISFCQQQLRAVKHSPITVATIMKRQPVGCALDIGALLLVAQLCTSMFGGATLLARVVVNLVALLMFFGVVAARQRWFNTKTSTSVAATLVLLLGVSALLLLFINF